MIGNKDQRAGGRYASAVPFVSQSNDNIVDEDDKLRWQAYQFYDDVYHNRPETFTATIRGEDDEQVPIYLPSGGALIDAVSRFLGVEFGFRITLAPKPDSENLGEELNATDDEIQLCQLYFEKLFKREKIATKFDSAKRYGLTRGDALFHVIGDDTKSVGSRVSINELHPGQYFPISGGLLGDKHIGCHIVSVVPDPRDPKESAALRQTYRYVLDNEGNKSGGITTELAIFETGKWDDRNPANKIEKIQQVVEEQPLDPRIDVIPVYHIKNNEIPGDDFGRSELAGFETLLNAVNQSMTDEDMTLVMQGLGMYWTDAPPPTDANGNEASWQVGPGQVIEVGAGQNFGRLTGVSSVAPFQDHVLAIEKRMQQRLGLSDVAVGDIDVATVESGIALKMKLAPIIARNAIKEEEIASVTDQMLYDVAMKWYPVYEGIDFGSAVPECTFGDPLPADRKATIDEILLLLGATPPLITLAMAQKRLAELGGYEFNDASESEVYQQMITISDILMGNYGSGAAPQDDTAPPEGEEPPPAEGE